MRHKLLSSFLDYEWAGMGPDFVSELVENIIEADIVLC